MEVINNIAKSYQNKDPTTRSVQKHVKESIKDRNQQYFKQRKPTVTKKTTKNIKPQLKITDIVNRNISRSNSLSSISSGDIDMISRSNSLDSISTMKREYNDHEMISRPPSVSSIQDSIKKNIDLSFKQPIATNKPVKLVKDENSIIDVKPKQDKIPALNAAQKAVIAKGARPKTTDIKKKSVVTTPLARAVLNTINKQKVPPKPPTLSLNQSIEKPKLNAAQREVLNKKKNKAAKADIKKKREEQVVRWRSKNEDDVEMAQPITIGKRKKESSLQSEAKTKKEN